MKYIVYKTTNLVNNYIYIGVHKTSYPDTWDCYLGCGVRTNKPSTYENAKTAFQQAVKEFGCSNFRRETLAVFDTADEAYLLEGLIVNENFLARSDVYNMILGGALNYAKEKHVYEYDSKNGKFLREYNTCADAAASVGKKVTSGSISRAIKCSYKVFGRCFSFIKCDEIDVSIFENPNESITVYRYLKTGEFDKEFTSLSSASKNTLNANPFYIHQAAILGYNVKDLYYFSLYKEDSYDKARSKQIQNREVHQYDANGNYIKSYASQKEAELDNPFCNITKSIKLRKPDRNGNCWGLEKVSIYNRYTHRLPKKVAKLDKNGNILQTWESFNQCAKEVGRGVQPVLQGKRKHHKGYVYKYIE